MSYSNHLPKDAAEVWNFMAKADFEHEHENLFLHLRCISTFSRKIERIRVKYKLLPVSRKMDYAKYTTKSVLQI